MIAVVDYGLGNLFSVTNALNFLGIKNTITDKLEIIERSDSIILPGVGAFPDAKKMLDKRGLTEFLKAQAKIKPFLGICLGAQLLFDRSFEDKDEDGLALIEGCVKKICAPGLKIPHVGWNNLCIRHESPLLKGVSEGSFVYFVHSYRIDTDERNIAASCEYGEKIPAVVENGNIFGTQFHPEKSGCAGLTILKNFGGLT